MPRSLLACIVASCLAVSAGCRMCANPYDECGPMSGHGCSRECGSSVRAGSVLSGQVAPVADDGEWTEPIAIPSDATEAPTRQSKSPSKTGVPPAEGWKSSKAAEPPKSGGN